MDVGAGDRISTALGTLEDRGPNMFISDVIKQYRIKLDLLI